MYSISTLTKITLMLITLTTMMSNVAIITVIPHLKDYFDNENIELLSRLMITLPSLSIAILAPFLGHIIDKIGKKISTVVSLILFSITGTAGLYLDSMESLLLSRALLGVSIAALMIVATSLVGDYFTGQQRHKYMGIQSAFTSIGGILFVVGGGFLSDINWRLSFAIYGIGIILLPFVIKFLIEIQQPQEDTQEVEQLNTNLFYIYFLAFLVMVVFYILPTQIPFLMINHFGASGVLTGAIISSAFVFHAIGSMSFAKLKTRFSFVWIYIIGMSTIAFGFILIGLVQNVYLFFITAPIMGFGGGILMTNVTAWMLSKSHHNKRVKSSGYLTSSLFLGQFFSPLLTMPVVSIFGVQDFFIVMGITVLLFIVFAILIIRRRLK